MSIHLVRKHLKSIFRRVHATGQSKFLGALHIEAKDAMRLKKCKPTIFTDNTFLRDLQSVVCTTVTLCILFVLCMCKTLQQKLQLLLLHEYLTQSQQKTSCIMFSSNVNTFSEIRKIVSIILSININFMKATYRCNNYKPIVNILL